MLAHVPSFVCCCGPCASAGDGAGLRSVVRCSLPVPPPLVLLPVVLRVPGGAVLAGLLFPLLPLVGALWCSPPLPPKCFAQVLYILLVGCVLVVPPPPPRWLWCPVLCFVVCSDPLVCGVFYVVPGVVWRACVGLGSCAVLFGAVLCWVFLCCFSCALLSCAAAFSAGFFFFLAFPWCWGWFCFCALLVRCCGGVSVSLLSVQCFLAPAALAGVLCCCLLCLRLCYSAWLSSLVSWCVLATPGVVFRWGPVVCPWVLCGAVLLRVVLSGVVFLCAVVFSFALFGAVARCVMSWGPVPSGAVFCLVFPHSVCFSVVCCYVVLLAAVLCAVCVLGCCVVRSLSSLPCAVSLCGPTLPWCPAPLCCASWCRAAVWCCGVLSCCLFLVCFLCLFGFCYLKNRCKI